MSTSIQKKDTAPSKSTIDALNKIRNQYGIVAAEYSDIFSIPVSQKNSSDVYKTLGQMSMDLLGESYRSHSERLLSSTRSAAEIAKVSNWRKIESKGDTELRKIFAKAYTLINYSSFGVWANAQYSDNNTVTKVAGGVDNFPIYPADMRFMANGPKPSSGTAKDTPGVGYSRALTDIRKSFQDQAIYFDFLNAASYILFNDGVVVSGKKITGSYFIDTVLKSYTSDDYQRYLRAAKNSDSKEIRSAADYFYSMELSTVAFLSSQNTTRVNIDRQSSAISAIVSDVFNGKKFTTQINTLIQRCFLTF